MVNNFHPKPNYEDFSRILCYSEFTVGLSCYVRYCDHSFITSHRHLSPLELPGRNCAVHERSGNGEKSKTIVNEW